MNFIFLDVDKTLMDLVFDLEEAEQIVQEHKHAEIIKYRKDDVIINRNLIQAVKNVLESGEDVQIILFTCMDHSDLAVSDDFSEYSLSRRQLLLHLSELGIQVSDIIMPHDSSRDLSKEGSTWKAFFKPFHQDMEHARMHSKLTSDPTELKENKKRFRSNLEKKIFSVVELRELYEKKHEENKKELAELKEKHPDLFRDTKIEELGPKYSMLMSFCRSVNDSIHIWFADDQESNLKDVSLAAKVLNLNNPKSKIVAKTHQVTLISDQCDNEETNRRSNTVESYEQSMMALFEFSRQSRKRKFK